MPNKKCVKIEKKNSYDTTIWRWTSITSKEDNGKDNKRSNPRIFLEIKKNPIKIRRKMKIK